MYKQKTIAVVIPCFNEEKQIGKVIQTMPDFIDHIVVIDDKSSDKTTAIVKQYLKKDKPACAGRRIILIKHQENQGVGGAIASGYKWCRDNKISAAVVMAGDGQMLPSDLPAILDPVVEDKADYAKANRLITDKSFKKIPKIRYFGNSVLSFLTKIASGYWHIMDSQSGYTAINKKMLELIDWDKMFKRYGQPNDLLVRLNVYNARVKDITVEPVYNIGEISRLKISKVFFTIPLMLLKMFLWRLKEKYIIRNFHPLVLFYFCGFFTFIVGSFLFLRLIYFLFTAGYFPSINFLAWMLCVLTSTQFTLFAMWFDMEDNKELR